MDNERIQLEAYRLIRIAANQYDGMDDDKLGAYVRGVVHLQTQLYGIRVDEQNNRDER